MRDLLQLGGKLLLFTLVAAVLLAATNMVTEGPIAEQQLAASQEAQRAVLPEATSFEEMDLAQVMQEQGADPANYTLLTSLYQGFIDGTSVGYVLTASPMGYGGPIPITMGVGADGSIHGISVGDLSETSGLGTKVGEAPFLSQYTALAADPAVIEADVDTISGATVSSSAFKQATEQMTNFTENVLQVEPHPGQPPLSADDLARQQLLPEAKTFEQVNPMTLLGDYDTIADVYRGVSGDETVGYTFDLAPQGYVDVIDLRLSLDAEGNIVALEVLSNSESEDYGQRISREPEFIDSFAGKPADPAAIDGIDALSGATGTSDAVKGSVKQAINFYNAYLAPGAAAEATEAPDAVSEATGEETTGEEVTATSAPEATPDAVSEATGEESTGEEAVATDAPAPTPSPAADTDSSATE